jgi:hypothetical protein
MNFTLPPVFTHLELVAVGAVLPLSQVSAPWYVLFFFLVPVAKAEKSFFFFFFRE